MDERKISNLFSLQLEKVRKKLDALDFSFKPTPFENAKEAAEKITDPAFRKAFLAVFDKIHDKKFITDYFLKLQTEAFELMKSSTDPKIIGLLNKGEVSPDFLIQVLRNRADAQGLDIINVVQRNDLNFREKLGRGLLYRLWLPGRKRLRTWTVCSPDSTRHGFNSSMLKEQMPLPALNGLDQMLFKKF